jgi:hypothetical protein
MIPHFQQLRHILVNNNKKEVQIIFKIIPTIRNYNYNLFTKITF